MGRPEVGGRVPGEGMPRRLKCGPSAGCQWGGKKREYGLTIGSYAQYGQDALRIIP